MKTFEIKSWTDLATVAENVATEAWIFRGVDSCRYPLIPKIGRKGARKDDKDCPLPYSRDDEIQMFVEFRRVARPLVDHLPVLDIEWLAVGQHHGLPTRLLDWTTSLLVAAYFAAENGLANSGLPQCFAPPAIYGLRGVAPWSGDDGIFKCLDEVVTYRPPHISRRIVAQKGLFTLHGRPDREFAPDDLHQWIIREPMQIKYVLDSIGINRATMFPGLEGTAEYLGWLYKRSRLPS